MNDHPPTESDSTTALSSELLGEVADLLSGIARDRIHPGVRPEGTEVDRDWLSRAARAQYGLLGAALEEGGR